ncbi:MAG: hypothetical protein U9Q81_12090 [Pseudomonadota bacterium]|nr:hypothetical protein [Pseudomonadota bacterium]
MTLTYLAHALAFGVGAVLAALAWVVYGRRSGRATLLLFLCFLPCTVFFFFDLVQDTFSPIAGTEVTLRRQPLTMLPIGTSAQRLFSTTYSLAGWRDWAAFLPFIGAILVGAAIGFWQSRPVVRRSSTFLIVAVLLVTIAFVALPDGVGLLNYLTQRIGIFSVGFLSLFAAWFWYSRESAWRALAVFLTLIAVASSLMDIGANARKVQEIAGPSLEGRLRGRYITAHIRRCEQGPQSPFGQYEPERHLWAYALGPGAVTPYLFSWNRYHPVQYRGEMYAKTLTAPDERINAADGDIGLDCAQSNQDRIHATCTCAGYDGSILVGEPATLEKEVGLSKVKVERRIAPGIVLARCEQERSRTIVEPGKLSSSHYLVRGWSTPETIDDRLAIWSVGRSSELAFRLVAADTPYQLSFVAKPYHRALPQTVSVKVNGSPIGKVELTYDWGRYMLPLDRALIRENVARLRFEYSQVNTPAEAEPGSHDVRELAVLFHRIEVEPIEGLSIASMPRSTTTPNITAASSTARSRTSM